MTDDDYSDHDRLVAMNTLVEEFRGWHDDAPHLPDQVKVINITVQNYYSLVAKSDVPWIIAFVKKNKSQEHLVHSEELY